MEISWVCSSLKTNRTLRTAPTSCPPAGWGAQHPHDVSPACSGAAHDAARARSRQLARKGRGGGDAQHPRPRLIEHPRQKSPRSADPPWRGCPVPGTGHSCSAQGHPRLTHAERPRGQQCPPRHEQQAQCSPACRPSTPQPWSSCRAGALLVPFFPLKIFFLSI